MRAVSHIWNTFSALMKLYFTTINQSVCNVLFLLPISKRNCYLDRWPYLWLYFHVGSHICSVHTSPQQPLSGHTFCESYWTYLNVVGGTREHNCMSILKLYEIRAIHPEKWRVTWSELKKMAAGSLSQYGHRVTMSYSHSLLWVSKVKIVSPVATRLTQRVYVLILRDSESRIRLLYFSTRAKKQRQCVCVCRNIAWHG